jgi:hypothetical protein
LESLDVAKVAIKMALSTRSEEAALKETYSKQRVKVAGVDFGGDLNNSIKKIIERTMVAAKREGVIDETHVAEGALVGAARDALSQVMSRALGLNIGGKIGIARCGEHISVAMIFGVGLLNLNEVALGLGHRSMPNDD